MCYDMMAVRTRLTMAIILQQIQIPNYYVVYLKFMLYINYTSKVQKRISSQLVQSLHCLSCPVLGTLGPSR